MSTTDNKPAQGTPDALTQDFNGKPLTATVFGYEPPASQEKSKAIVRLCRSDIVYSTVQVLKEGGENNLKNERLNATPQKDFSKEIQYL